jgi:hypothetical protein
MLVIGRMLIEHCFLSSTALHKKNPHGGHKVGSYSHNYGVIMTLYYVQGNSKFLCSGATLFPTRMDGPVVLYIQPLASESTFLCCSLIFQFYTFVIDV